MAKVDDIFTDIYQDIIDNGELREKNIMFWKDGTPAYHKSVIGRTLTFKVEDGFPLLTKKFVPTKSFSQEMLWIWQKKSNVVEQLRQMGSPVWNEWELPNGTIGKAYGYQLKNNYYSVDSKTISDRSIKTLNLPFKNKEELQKKSNGRKLPLNQVDYVIQQLIDNPNSRQILTNMWKVQDLKDMSLQPCVYETQWIVYKGRLELLVTARSSDSFLGLPFNVAQYALLQRLIAHITKIPCGDLIFRTGDLHIYDRHIPLCEKFNANPEFKPVDLWIDDSVEHFEDFVYNENFKFLDYKKGVGNAGFLASEVSVKQSELDRMNKK